MRHLHLGVNYKVNEYLTAGIEFLLNGAKDWLKYAPNCWVFYTDQSLDTWHDKFLAVPGMEKVPFFICEVNLANSASHALNTSHLLKSDWFWVNSGDEAMVKVIPISATL